jgi:copper chaperone NosL
VLGLIAAISNNKWMFVIWLSLFVIGCCIGLYDFYLWEYDYGHDLAPNAPMKFEGTSFQPPLIGTKVLLNFIAKSFPHIGGYFAMLSIFLASIGVYLKWKPK